MKNESQGWVKIYRQIMNSAGYFSEPFCRNMAWVDMILLANHDTGFFRCRGIRIEVKRGQIGHGLDELAKRWKWSRGKVERFMKELEFEKQIVRQKNNVTTLISLTNYNDYQSSSKADDKANDKADGQQTVKQTVKQTDANKNVKNEKNENNKKKREHLFRESVYFDKSKLIDELKGTEYESADLDYYYEALLNWSDSGDKLKTNWLSTARAWINKDRKEGSLKINVSKNGNQRINGGKNAGANQLSSLFACELAERT